jgi:molybdopterin-binding protein
MNGEPVVSIAGCTKEYNGRRVLDLPSLEVIRGTAVALTGHNGSGKTTLLRIVAGLERPTAGKVTLAVDRVHTGFCPQKPYMFRGSVRKNLVWGMASPDWQAVGALASRLQLDSLLDWQAKQCSAGEKQKVSLGRVLIRNPSLLLLDEPTANLDQQARTAIEDEFTRFVHNGGTCVMATHMVDHAQRLAAEIVRLEQGRVTHAEVDNVFEGAVKREGETTIIAVTDRVSVFCSEGAAPGKHRFCIAAADLVLSREPLASSMRNSFQGVINGLRATSGAIEASVDIGIPLRALVTRESLARLSLSIGSRVVVSFKAVAVRLL